ncbi:MAG: endolytic transglycosylase MltG [Desulfobacterales bacterium]|nr:endolytic transglycosylase MltG [Desulfobacterales bacterium]
MPENKAPEKESKSSKKMIGYILIGFFFIVTAVAATGLIWMKAFLNAPAASDAPPRVFTITPGQSLDTIAQNLTREGLITDPLRFKLYTRFKKAATRIKAGEYQLSPAQTPDLILTALLTGRVKLYRFTVPEGLNLDEIALLAQKAGFCTSEKFLSLCRDIKFIRELNLPGHTLEGYLYPDTYYFPKNTGCRAVIKKMTATFDRVFSEKWKKRAKTLGFSVHEIVTLASIIEKETGDASERPLIASVFHNRLKKRMRLESDPTVIYGVDDYHGRIRYKHLRRKTPYNTYQMYGLPLGPIASPGALALEAALYPETSDYLFFVSKNDTTHQFSKNLRDHNKAVRKYQLKAQNHK